MPGVFEAQAAVVGAEAESHLPLWPSAVAVTVRPSARRLTPAQVTLYQVVASAALASACRFPPLTVLRPVMRCIRVARLTRNRLVPIALAVEASSP